MTRETQKASEHMVPFRAKHLQPQQQQKKNLKTQQWPNRNRSILDLSGKCAKIIISYTCA